MRHEHRQELDTGEELVIAAEAGVEIATIILLIELTLEVR